MSGKIELKTRKGQNLIWCNDCSPKRKKDNKNPPGFKAFGNINLTCPYCNKTYLVRSIGK